MKEYALLCIEVHVKFSVLGDIYRSTVIQVSSDGPNCNSICSVLW